ncbi:SprB repeat-containing protein, partial [Flavobacterium sp. MAHUQ-51]
MGKMIKNKILSSHLLLFISLFFSVNTYGQLVDPGAIRANFGVDGDAYGNFQGFTIITPPGSTTPPSVTIGVDDWFVNKTPPPDSLGVRSPYWDGTGLNVIDQRDGATLKAAIQANNNYSFTRRQSRPPLSIVMSTVNGVPTPYLWIDAVYGRDNNSAQSNSDATIFTSTSDKNPDNPTTYNIGSGSVPQKDDIIDVMAHLRGEGPKNPTAQDPRPFTTLYAYGAATLRATSGSKHIDFEFYRTLVEATGSTLTNTGPDGGRTAFTFNPDGSLNKPGTIIVSIDYEGGGTKPDVRIRVWMSKASFDALLLNPSARPFNVVAGSFEQGLSSGDFGYARITALTEASASIWGRVNAEGSTLAAPWGTLEGSTANWYEEYQTLQHVEIGINLTAFNLDRKDESDPCSNILGSLLVKTRSCAGGNNDPFSCELKDFAGPYAFGFTVKPEVVLAVDRVITCANPSATITASGVKPNGAPIEFYGPDPTPLDKTDGLGPLIAAEDAAPDFNRTVTAGGVYAVVVTAPGFAGCTATSYITVEEDKALPSASDSHTDVSCNGGNNGSVTINFNGGTGPYEVNFNGGGFVTQTSPKVYTGLAAGTYSWVVRGANGCSVSGSETISEPTALLASDAHTNVSCNGGTDGSVTVTFSGGTAPYMVNFNGGGFMAQTSPKAYTGLAAGTYSWVVKDANGCEQSGSETITEPTALLASDAHTNVSCNGGTDGSVTVTFSGGTAPYMVNFNGGGFMAQTSPKAYTGLAAGTYSWVVKDANGCEQSGSETISEPTALLASDIHTNVSCNGGTDGSVTVTFSGGTAPYMVNFNGGGFMAQTSPKAYTGLAAGTYSWVVKDANGCEQSGSETISEPTALLASDAHTNVSCNGGTDGSVTVTFSGGTAPYMVNFNGGGFVTQTSPKAYTGLAAGTYSWVVKDANGCEQSGSETISEPTALLASDAHTNVSCNGGTDGSVTVTFSGGTAPYMVNFNGGGFMAQTSPKAYTGLAAGTYSWVVKDANGCEQSGSETISEPTALLASDAHTNVSCNGGTDGSVTVTFSGGTAPYMVNFNGGGFMAQTSPKAYTGLAAGTYSWVVKDANGCEQSGSETISEPTALLASDAHTNVSCNGGTDGSVTVTFSGGTAPYMVNFNGGGFVTQTSPKAYTGLAAGTYSWVVKDANGCEQSGSETISEPTALLASDAHTNVSCNGGTDGSVTVTFSGGTAPYMVNFNGGGFETQTSPKAYTGLAAGTYSWVVKDANGCEQSGSETISEPTALLASDAHTNVSCNGGTDGSVTVTFSGGTAPYMVNFNGGGFMAQTSPKAYTGLAAGTYSWVVKDANGCEQSGSETISEPTALLASDAHTNVSCNGGTDGSVTVTFSGGTAPYMVNFNGGGFMAQTSPKAYTGLAAGTYSWVVKDANGCEQSGSETISEPTALLASDAHTNVSCNGGTDGSVTVTFSGGTAPYMVNFNGGGFIVQTSPKAYTGLAAGTYSWVVKDANGCEQSGSETISEPTALLASDAHTNVSCNGGTDGSVTVTFSGGTAPYMVNFNGGGFMAQTSPKAYTGLAEGTYSWVVKDANGCEQSGSETISEPTALLAS